uniref:hypothetical protein n=1 Tax=Klebsiella pneumoniae TaxID=573 RepID=UPI002076974C|nr:hypothetical protein [Klebsiella pneumoniae]
MIFSKLQPVTTYALGLPGAGKSFAANNIILNYLCSGEHINPLYHFDDIRDLLTADKYDPPLDLNGKFNASPDGAQVFVVDIDVHIKGLLSNLRTLNLLILS